MFLLTLSLEEELKFISVSQTEFRLRVWEHRMPWEGLGAILDTSKLKDEKTLKYF